MAGPIHRGQPFDPNQGRAPFATLYCPACLLASGDSEKLECHFIASPPSESIGRPERIVDLHYVYECSVCTYREVSSHRLREAKRD